MGEEFKPRQQLTDEISGPRRKPALVENRLNTVHIEDEGRLLEIVEAYPVPILLCDGNHRTIFINQRFEQLFGYSRQQLPTLETLWPASHDMANENTIQGTLRELFMKPAEGRNEPSAIETAITCRDGSTRHIECLATTFDGKYMVICNDLTESRRTQDELILTNEKLKAWIYELELNNKRMHLLHQMGDDLQACRNINDAYAVIRRLVPLLFPKTTGALYDLDASGRFLKTVASWGRRSANEGLIAEEACLALRNGGIFRGSPSIADCSCSHMGSSRAVDFLCVPMLDAGEPQGLLHLNLQQSKEYEKGAQELALVVTEHLTLSLSNLKLREMLHMQAVRDPLTGLFNRRYMEESLEREFHRADRKQSPVSIMMLDIDHFKRFNDNHGHDAGDALLKSFGAILQNLVRKEDIACRFGGEEFILILPDTTLEIAANRAEHFRKELKCTSFKHQNQGIGTVTVSLGVATYPDHGPNTEAVIRKADEALYRAKNLGRNRVETASMADFQENGSTAATPLN